MVDRVNVGGDAAPDAASKQAAHDAAMIAVAESGVTSIGSVNKQTGEDINLQAQVEPVPGKPERPADVPEKFWDAEKGAVNVPALLKAQQDAEAALRRTQAGETPPAAAPAAEAAQDDAVAKATAEFAEKGEMSETTYEALAKVGLTRDVVDTYIEGQQAIVGQLEQSAFSAFDGTRESYGEAVKWAAANLSEPEIAALDVQLTSRNPAIVKQGALALAAKFKADADITPGRQIAGDGNASNTGSYFKSSFEMRTAMADARYGKDASYRAEVAQKISRADKAGVNLFG